MEIGNAVLDSQKRRFSEAILSRPFVERMKDRRIRSLRSIHQNESQKWRRGLGKSRAVIEQIDLVWTFEEASSKRTKLLFAKVKEYVSELGVQT